MRILHVCHVFKPLWDSGGMARVVYEISKHLVERGHEVTVYTTNWSHYKVNIEANKPVYLEGMKIYYFENLRKYFPKKNPPPVPYHLPFIARKEVKDFDVIHIHGHRTLLEVILHHYAKKYGIPYIIDPQGSILRREKTTLKKIFDVFFGYRILRDAYKVIAGTEREMNEEMAMGVDKKQIAIIPPGYDISSFLNIPDEGTFRNMFNIKEKNIILFLARINKIKGIDFLIKSFYELIRDRDDATLVIAGPDDGYMPVVEELIRDLNISNKVIFTGTLCGEKKLSAYADATVFVQPSRYERFCGSPFEAILCNTPIIVTKNTGCGDFVEKMDIGYTVEFDDIIGLKSSIEKILDDPYDVHRKTQKGIQYIKKNLTIKKQVERYEELYQRAMDENRRKNSIGEVR